MFLAEARRKRKLPRETRKRLKESFMAYRKHLYFIFVAVRRRSELPPQESKKKLKVHHDDQDTEQDVTEAGDGLES
jgi:hypothetical protein